MPTTTIHVYRVNPYIVTSHGDKFLIDSRTQGGIPNGQYQTWDPLVASLCDQASKQSFAVDVTWRDTRYGREIVRGGARKSEAAA